MDFQSEKAVVAAYYNALEAAPASESLDIIARYCTPDIHVRAMHPFHDLHGRAAVAERFWTPLKTAITRMQRRMDVFFAGRNQMDEFQSVWVSSMGHLTGLFDAPWLGLCPTGKLVMLRYAEFHKVEGDRITQSALFFDIPHLMIQIGLAPFAQQTAAHMVQPGPLNHDGLLTSVQDHAEGGETLAIMNKMIRDLGQWDLGLPLEEELARTWNDNMFWWGPAGIGSTYTIERYAKQHSGPFRAGFANRTKTNHLCRMAEGQFGGFFGWPNFTAEPTGGFMGMPATGKAGEFRVIDIYRRDGHKLAENWIYIDLLHFWNMQGVDVLGRMTQPSQS